MNLRNKKTGDTVEGYVMVGVQNNEKFPNLIEYHTYISLAELNDEWEDYKPVEHIFDEKINKDTYILEIINKAREWQKTKSISTSSNVCKMLNLLANEYLDK